MHFFHPDLKSTYCFYAHMHEIMKLNRSKSACTIHWEPSLPPSLAPASEVFSAYALFSQFSELRISVCKFLNSLIMHAENMVRAEFSQSSQNSANGSIYCINQQYLCFARSLARHLYRSNIWKCSKIAPIGTGISTKRRDFQLESSACTHARSNTYL